MSHPITPPAELVQQWAISSPIQPSDESWAYELFIAHQAAQWGADQELEACCEWVSQWCGRWPDGTRPEDELRTARRPKPPSLAESAKESLESVVECLKILMPGAPVDGAHIANIRAALERLQELE